MTTSPKQDVHDSGTDPTDARDHSAMNTDDGDRHGSDGTLPITHLYVLLDRSGSMQSIADDVIGGFNRLLADQQAQGPDARVTLIQFDGEDPQEVLADAVPIMDVDPLSPETFVPRGNTPLLDATARLLARAARRAKIIADTGGTTETIVVVSITDGHENASREMRLADVRRMIEERKRDGWTFVFLSAADDVYGEAGGLGYDDRSSQAFEASAPGVDLAFSTLSRATTNRREKIRRSEKFDADDFFEGDKPAEAYRELAEGSR